MALRSVRLYGTTDAGGDLVVASPDAHIGWLYAVQWIDGGFADGVDAVLVTTSETNPAAVDNTILTLTNANDDEWYYPRALLHGEDGVAGAQRVIQLLIDGVLELTVSSGGNAASGGCIVYYEDE